MTKDEWIDAVLERKADYAEIVSNYHPGAGDRVRTGHITAVAAEEACAAISNKIRSENPGLDPASAFQDALSSRNAEQIYSLMNSAWFGIPEDRELVRRIQGFDAMCDLLSDPWDDEERG